MIKDLDSELTVVIRTVQERTTCALRGLMEQFLPKENIVLVENEPTREAFIKASLKCLSRKKIDTVKASR